MTKDQVNRLAMSLGFPYDHSRNEVKDLEKLVRLVNCALDSETYKRIDESQKQDVMVVSKKAWRPIFQEFERAVREQKRSLAFSSQKD